MYRSTGVFVLILTLSFVVFAAATSGIIVRKSTLRSDASFASKAITTLAPGTQVNILKRKGGWQQVQMTTDKKEGWVRTYQVREGEVDESIISESKSEDRGVLANLGNLTRKATGVLGTKRYRTASQTTATTGIRGLDEKEVANAKPDEKELKLLKKYQVKKKAAKKFAEQAKLKKQKIKFL